MKKILKKEVIISFIVGVILSSSIIVYGVVNARDIDYTKPGTQTEINVETALNELYENKLNLNNLTLVANLSGTTTARVDSESKTFTAEGNKIYYVFYVCFFTGGNNELFSTLNETNTASITFSDNVTVLETCSGLAKIKVNTAGTTTINISHGYGANDYFKERLYCAVYK